MTSTANLSNRIPLDELSARDVSLAWFEAVALIQSTARRVIETGQPGFPSASQIRLGADGSVSVAETIHQQPTAAAAHLLSTMLADDVPVRLRLTLTQATRADGEKVSLPEFIEAVSYFERPAPEAILREVYLRAASAPRRERPGQAAVAPSLTEGQEEPRGSVRSRTTITWAVPALVLVAISAVGAWIAGPRVLSGWSADGSSEIAQPAVGAADRKPSDEKGHTPVNSTRVRRSADGIRASGRIAPPAPGLNPSRLTSRPITEFDWSPRQSGVVVQRTVTVFASDPVSIDRVYTAADPDVMPPQSLYPKLPSEPPGTPVDGRTVIELLVSSGGQVEHVRLRTSPRDIHEFMLASAAKAWRFDPATRDGTPVRFLHTVALALPH